MVAAEVANRVGAGPGRVFRVAAAVLASDHPSLPPGGLERRSFKRLRGRDLARRYESMVTVTVPLAMLPACGLRAGTRSEAERACPPRSARPAAVKKMALHSSADGQVNRPRWDAGEQAASAGEELAGEREGGDLLASASEARDLGEHDQGDEPAT
jgi:hypothetical protein